MKSIYSIILIIELFLPVKSNAQINSFPESNEVSKELPGNQFFSFDYLQKNIKENFIVLDSMLQTNYYGNDSIVYKSYYKYNSKGKLIEKTDFISDIQGNWHPQYKHEYIPDETEIHSLYIYYRWDSNTIQWIRSNKSEYILYPDGKLKVEKSFSYDSTSMDWRSSMKKEIGYDENGRFKHDTTSVWIESKNSWQYYMNYESELDENDNILWSVSSVFESSTDNWAILDKIEFEYKNGEHTKTENFVWSSTLRQWEKWQITEYSYDNYKNEVAWVISTWNNVLSDWVFEYQNEKEYNSNNQLVLETNYKWENENKKWNTVNKITRDYDNTENLNTEVIQEWNTDTNDWQTRSTSEYFYSEFISNINSDVTELEKIKIYPNPASKTLTIESANSEVAICLLYNSNGKLIKILPIENGTNTYNISELKNGIYYIQVQQEEKIVVRKLVKINPL